MKRFFVGLLSIFRSCFYPCECEGFQVGHPIATPTQIRRASELHANRDSNLLPARKGLRIKVVTLSGDLPQQNVKVSNAWNLMNPGGVNFLTISKEDKLKTLRLISAEQVAGNVPKGKLLVGNNGLLAVMSKESLKHLCNKHGDELGIFDLLPPNPNAKPTKYPSQGRLTRVEGEKGIQNQLAFRRVVREVMRDPSSDFYPNIKIRGENGYVYYTNKNRGTDSALYAGFIIGVQTEGPNTGRVMKAQSINKRQLENLRAGFFDD